MAPTGTLLDDAFRHAIRVGRRARSETEIGQFKASIPDAVVELLRHRVEQLDRACVLVVGAGVMGQSLVTALCAAGVSVLLLANRDPTRARAVLAGSGCRPDGRVVELAELPTARARADVVVTATTATSHLIGAPVVAAAMSQRSSRQLWVADISVPRNVELAVGGLDGVALVDMASVKQHIARSGAVGQEAVDQVREIVVDELDRFRSARSVGQLDPLLGSLHRHAESIRHRELARFAARLTDLTRRERVAVEAVTKGIVGKLLHPPTVALRQRAGSRHGEHLADAARELFEL